MAEQSARVPASQFPSAIREYFLSRYHTPSEAKWRAERLFAAWRYLDENASSFEQAGYALHSSQRGTATKYLFTALYRFFGVAADDAVGSPPAVGEFIAGAAEHEEHERHE